MRLTQKQLRQLIREEVERAVSARAALSEARFTVYVDFDGELEEIDVDAADERGAREQAQAQLATDYQPGGKIVKVVRRLPGQMY